VLLAAGDVWDPIGSRLVRSLACRRSDRREGKIGSRFLDPGQRRTSPRDAVIDGLLAVAVLAGLILNAWAGRWWADPAAAFVIVLYAGREGRHALLEANRLQPKCSC
jgi:hypothetical protein